MTSLYILSAPIGCLEDVSIRFLQTVSNLKYLAVEDTRQTAKLLRLLQAKWQKYQLWPKILINLSKEKERTKTFSVIDLLKQNLSVGLLSDAGTPLIADPGAYLVEQVRKAGFLIEAIPGPSALTTALSLSGFESDLSIFMGFLPKKPDKKFTALLAAVNKKLARSVNIVFFESPQRIKKTVTMVFELFPNSQLFLGRELTKKHQELLWLEADKTDLESIKNKGEYTAVLKVRMV
jgi:16S rRNA (cytidine1402-2'-O)-methyltransferase